MVIKLIAVLVTLIALVGLPTAIGILDFVDRRKK